MKYLVVAVILFGLGSCSTEPEELRYGVDACHHCKMTLMDKKFGGELVTSKGKVFKFDDVNCMMSFYNSGEVAEDAFSHKLVINFAKPSSLIEADIAFYLKSSAIKAPMNSQVAAFATKEELEEAKKQLDGIYLVWGELVTQFK